MPEISEYIGKADWKTEKHVPVIECPDTVKADELFQVKVTLGKEVAHPNTTEHHIRWVSLYFHAKGEKFAYEVAHVEFNAHGESTEGPNKGPVYTHHEVINSMKTSKAGVLHALAYCNIHGLWESSKEISIS
jgi:superoxide reductase